MSGSPSTPPGGSPEKWFYKTDAAKAGPVGTEQLRELLANGTLPPQTPVWRHGMQAWVAASQCDEFALAAQGFSAEDASQPRRTDIRRYLPSTVPMRILSATIALLGVYVLVSVLSGWKGVATVRGFVTTNSRRVDGGTIILSPVADGSLRPGKPGVCDLTTAGEFVIRVEAGEAGIAKTARVQYIPPVLPPMGEEEAKTAVPRYFGLVPKPDSIPLAAGDNRVEIELVAAPGVR